MTESTSLYSYRFGQFELQPSERRLLAAGVPAVVDHARSTYWWRWLNVRVIW